MSYTTWPLTRNESSVLHFYVFFYTFGGHWQDRIKHKRDFWCYYYWRFPWNIPFQGIPLQPHTLSWDTLSMLSGNGNKQIKKEQQYSIEDEGQIEMCSMYFLTPAVLFALRWCVTPILWHFHLKTMSSHSQTTFNNITLCVWVWGVKGSVLLSWLRSKTLKYMTSALWVYFYASLRRKFTGELSCSGTFLVCANMYLQ